MRRASGWTQRAGGAGRRRPASAALAALAGAALLTAGPEPAGGQTPDARGSVPVPERVRSPLAPVPFGPGEQAEYEVTLGPFSVGGAIMQVVTVEPVRSRPSYHISWRIEAGIPLARVDDHFESWVDVETLATLRSLKKVREVGYSADRHYEIYPEAGYWDRLDTGESEKMITALPLDDVSFVYYARSLPLEVGETYTLDRYFIADRNPVILEVLRKETIEVPAGTFETIVVRPIIKARGLFGEGGEAEIYLTDDDRRLLVRLSSRVPVLGSLSLHLRSAREGVPIRR
ncbi:MAG: DUF3108 domain-containing protein [Gammaproteobacteria bacterium]|nr:DUF3108 domain-containing protein [Gammaproteobacteria bacterium]